VDTLLQFRRYRLPLRTKVRTAHGPITEREGVLVRLEAADGRVGFGEAAPMPEFGGETIEAVVAELDRIGTRAEADVFPTEGCVGFALQCARSNLARTATPPIQSSLTVAAWLPAGQAAIRELAEKAEAGFRTFKLKVGVEDPAREMGLLDDLCAEMPEGAKIRLDANGAWDRRVAERWLQHCAERPVEFVEQPVAAEARGAADLLRGLAADFPTPIALDESLAGAGAIERWLALGWPGVWVLKPSLLGGAATLDRLGRELRRAHGNADVVFSSALETGVGAQAALRMAFAWPGELRAVGFGVWPLFADPTFDGPFAAPFLSPAEVERINPETLWNALA
jgi:O-succinylbenzoate synthase